MARQFELLDKPKRRSPHVLMRVYDAGERGNQMIVCFRCPKCSHIDDWVPVGTVTEAKRGLPCPKCNET